MRLFASLIAIALIVSSCSSVSVAVDYDKTIDFSEYKTFNVKSPSVTEQTVDPERINKRNLEAINRNIKENMLAKGYTESTNPDLWISYYVKVDTKQELRSTSYGYYGGNPYYYGPYYGYNYGYTDVSTIEYTEGTLIIDIVDAKKNLLVWQGVGTKTINENKIDHSEDIRKTVGQIFYKYRFAPLPAE
ncbi:DUF4136 domain-containing protein [bacterium SCSIO 12741]|nr:DUF4136 domain-containing protein [bacterium SCSIO 12741]